MLIVIRGAGDLATGIALRLYRAHLRVVMTDLPVPTCIRRTVSFAEAIRLGSAQVENIEGVLADTPQQAEDLTRQGKIAVMADPSGLCITALRPDAVVDAILAKRNLGTRITDAPVVIGVGPGFTAGEDCHACVETMRGHYLGRALYEGSPEPNTNIPGLIGGYAGERVLRAPADGVFVPVRKIGDRVEAGDVAGTVNGVEMRCTIGGVLRGLLAEGVPVHKGMKSGDVDPRCKVEHCWCASDKAIAIGGGVLEAILHFTEVLK
ncbi:MAG: selenium-dependent molybdenum cofactor biosynthesis protein YqeB [Firmicutes bacterium]|nr:selenium-dependent molybdenum cofactor biosynthesis protein YqeB [Bacillota bacterium]MDY2719194.1 selenium-dependent molybdenum cofactor biosynthesis protein YqeB [Candidatus Faecousia sp.]